MQTCMPKAGDMSGAISGDSYMGIGGIVFFAALAIVAEPVALGYLANVVTFAMDPDSCKESIVNEQMREIQIESKCSK